MAATPKRSFTRTVASTVEDRSPGFLLSSLALAGVAALIAAALVSLRSFETRFPPGSPPPFDCGSVLFPKDPRNLAPPRANRVPLRLARANARCDKIRSDRTHRAIVYMVAGVVPLLLVLALPFLSRRSRRRGRRRVRM